ncbi:MAG: 23S rRNA (pseudouridine(1915)-N(3))-methyltransferase RlmH [Steroidobacteraceae bacterium]
MLIRLLAAGTRLPGWVDQAYQEYARRLAAEVKLELIEIPTGRGSRGGDRLRARADEGRRMLERIEGGDHVVALEVGGRALSSEGLADWLGLRLREGRRVVMLVGGADGLDPACLERADFRWSLSPLTFPHGLVRVILAEQVYRAWSQLRGHPYHRG